MALYLGQSRIVWMRHSCNHCLSLWLWDRPPFNGLFSVSGMQSSRPEPFHQRWYAVIFLVVKVNWSSSVFNIIKFIWLLRNIKNKNIWEKSVRKCVFDDLFTFWKWWRRTTKTNNWTPQTVCWVLTVGLVVSCNICVMRWEITVVKMGKVTFHWISIATQTKTCAFWYDVTQDDEPKNNYTKSPLNVYFLAFCGVIYQHLLHRLVYITVSSVYFSSIWWKSVAYHD